MIAFLQWRVYWQGVDFSGRLSSATKMPGLQHSSLLGTHWQVDLSDVQWRDFRGGLPLLAAVMAAFVAASHVVGAFTPMRGSVMAPCSDGALPSVGPGGLAGVVVVDGPPRRASRAAVRCHPAIGRAVATGGAQVGQQGPPKVLPGHVSGIPG